MKVKVKREAFYNQQIYKEGAELDYIGDSLPSWATLADGVEPPKAKNTGSESSVKKVSELPDEEKTALVAEANSVGITGNLGKFGVDKLKAKIAEEKAKNTGSGLPASAQINVSTEEITEDEVKEKLETLLNEAIELGIVIEDTDKKTIREQIEELTKKIAEKKA